MVGGNLSNDLIFQQQSFKTRGMDKKEDIEALVQEINEEAINFSNAENPNEEVEALKEMLDTLMCGSKLVLEKIDQYNDRRYR